MTFVWQRPFRSIRRDLPIFRQDDAEVSLFYAAGYLVVVVRRESDAFEQALAGATDGGANRWASAAEVQTLLTRAAEIQQSAATDTRNSPFNPVCLTLYLHNACNLHCTYCYAEAHPARRERLSIDTIRMAAELVAVACAARSLPFTVVFHGGGEPTLDEPLLFAGLAETETVARRHQVHMFRYIATNGVMPAERAQKIAARFDLVGLSCDGTPDIQARQRPLFGSGSSMPGVERTARILDEVGTPYHVRVTVTAATAPRLEEIARYLCEHMHPQEIHVEPVYRAGRAALADADVPDPQDFVEAFLAARRVAEGAGVKWLTAGSRPWEMHGPYCNVFRDVLQITPNGTAVHCFKVTETANAASSTVIGQPGSDQFRLDQERIVRLRDSLLRKPSVCEDCFNQFHCARDCPEQCPLEEGSDKTSPRCDLNRWLAVAHLQRAAENARAHLGSARYAIGIEINSP